MGGEYCGQQPVGMAAGRKAKTMPVRLSSRNVRIMM